MLVSAMLLRPALATEAPILADCWYAMLDEERLLSPEPHPAWRELLAGDFAAGIAAGGQVWYVVEAEEGIVACGGAFVRRDAVFTALMGVQATLGGIYTQPAFRRRGYARAIVRALLTFGRSDGWEHVRLRASAMGRPLYEQLGFVAGDEMVLPHDAFAALVHDEGSARLNA